MTGFTITIPGPPRTKKNSSNIVSIPVKTKDGRPVMRNGSVVRRPIILPSEEYLQWFKTSMSLVPAIRDWAHANQIKLPITGPVHIKATFYKDANHRGDLCGYLQALGDFLQARKVKIDQRGVPKVTREGAGIIDDDYDIYSWDGSRVLVDRINPRIDVEIRPMQDHMDLAEESAK